jgi:putative transposase
MARTARKAVGGLIYHVLNRGNNRNRIFHKSADYLAFIQLLVDACDHADIKLFAFCLMPNHWHLVLQPKGDRDLATFMSWLTNTHVKRYRAHHHGTSGHLYQGRYKSFPIQSDEHLLMVLRYVEANATRAKLVRRAQDWRWSSLGFERERAEKLLSDWPIDRPVRWLQMVNNPLDPADAARLKASIERDRPFGTNTWARRMAKTLGLEHTLNPRGRPSTKKVATTNTKPK